MNEASNARETVVRLRDGEDLVPRLVELGLDAAVIFCGIGMLRDLEIGYWNGERYEIRTIEEPVELLSLQGNLARHGDERVLHAHVCVASEDGVARGGHLVRATVHNTVELGMVALHGIALVRRKEENGLLGLTVEDA